MSPEETKQLFNQRLGRYQAAIALEPTDRIPIATGSNYFAEIYSGNTQQQTLYDPQKWLEAEEIFIRDFPEIDVLRNNRIYGPLYDAIDCKTYRLPGRDLPPDTQFQFVEKEYMKPDEYDILIDDPKRFLFDCFLPRVLGEFAEKGTPRSYIAFLKAGMAQMMMGQVMRNRAVYLEQTHGMPQPMTGAFLAPFDVIADAMRGLTGIMTDLYRCPEKLKAACEVVVHEIANFALATADPFRRYPIFVPTHKAMFLSPEQFDEFYWPSFKKTIEILIEAGYTVRAYLEGDWSAHLHRLRELPKGKVVCDIDSQGDIFTAKEILGGYQCIAGGVKDSQLILGTPQQMRSHVKLLCETVGKDGGFMISGGCNFPYTTKAENLRALIDAVLEFGVYDSSISPQPRKPDPQRQAVPGLEPQQMLTPWASKLSELGGVQGDEALIRTSWEQLESMAYNWMWQWVM
ncbi:MAG: uroporphyrinogen decarboxylase [Deltaproteobacteria bacterium SG8_13]|nr:MAG: uroporphyrinogen decarboxylase [Deltaproteobacteria bacterium SG8_13]